MNAIVARREQERTTITTRQAIGAPLASSIALFSIFLVVKYTDVSVGVAYQVGHTCCDRSAGQEQCVESSLPYSYKNRFGQACSISLENSSQGCRVDTLLLKQHRVGCGQDRCCCLQHNIALELELKCLGFNSSDSRNFKESRSRPRF